MSVNEAGRQMLIEDLRRLAPYYGQHVWAEVDVKSVEGNECGTVMCMGGLCYLRLVGWETFHKNMNEMDYDEFGELCLQAGRSQLGLRGDHFPEIFKDAIAWPSKLYSRYHNAEEKGDHAGVAEVAIEALNAMNDLGHVGVYTNVE